MTGYLGTACLLIPFYTAGQPAPVAEFEADVTSGNAPLTVQFIDLSANDPTGWDWDFGDGNHSTEQNPEHEYAEPGLCTVSLFVFNAAGSDTETKTDLIEVL